jgi:hypothetical protein
MEETKTIRLDNADPWTAVPSVQNNPLYKILTLKIGAFKELNPQLSEEQIQEQLGKHIRNYMANKKNEWRPKLLEYLNEIYRRHKQAGG